MSVQTITDDYARLNRELHESPTSYGQQGWRHLEKVLLLREDTDSTTILDYGCGKGTLKDSLGSPDWCFEYDPAVAGKDVQPEAADLLVCTDVLEHVEPDLLGNVLDHIVRLTGKAAYLVIATRPSVKLLPDGTSPHKIVETPKWWEAKLAEKFYILDFANHNDREVTALVSPVRPIKEIRGKSAVSDGIRYEQAERNCKVVRERVFGGDLEPRHEGRVCIVGFAPSLHQTWHYLDTERRLFGAKIVSVSGAHDFLLSRGIVPDYHVDIDPREHKAFFTRNPHSDVAYYIASCCHPQLIDNLVSKGSKLALWHLYNSDNDLKIFEPDGADPGSLIVCGGSGVGARAVHLFYALGYRSFSLYGMDSSFSPADGAQHAGEHSGKKKSEWNVRVNERWFLSSAQLVYMARSMLDSMYMLEQISAEQGEPVLPASDKHVEFFLHGDGLLQEMVIDWNSRKANA